MPLSASARFASERAPPPARRRILLLCGSLIVHAAVVCGLGGLARPALRDTPPTAVELMFDAPPSEIASVAPPDPAVAAAEPLTAAAQPPAPETAPPAPLAESISAPQAASVPPPTLAEAPPEPQKLAVEIPKALPRMAQKRSIPRPPAAESPVRESREAAAPIAETPTHAPPVTAAPAPISPDWQGTLASWIRARTRYPEEARRLGQQGGVVISLTVGRDGQVLLASLARHSGSEVLDQSALDMFRATRVPAFPPEMPQAQITISVPVRYRLEP